MVDIVRFGFGKGFCRFEGRVVREVWMKYLFVVGSWSLDRDREVTS